MVFEIDNESDEGTRIQMDTDGLPRESMLIMRVRLNLREEQRRWLFPWQRPGSRAAQESPKCGSIKYIDKQKDK